MIVETLRSSLAPLDRREAAELLAPLLPELIRAGLVSLSLAPRESEVYVLDEAAERLKMGRRTLDGLVDRGEISSYTEGRSRRISHAQLEAYVIKREGAAGFHRPRPRR